MIIPPCFVLSNYMHESWSSTTHAQLRTAFLQTRLESKVTSMADSLLLPVVTRVASKATDELVQSVTRMWGIDTDRGKLERLLLAVQCMLPDAKVKGETTPALSSGGG
jgi:hypothetical protein